MIWFLKNRNRIEMIRFSRKGKHKTLYTYSFLKNQIPDQYIVDENQILGIGNFGVVFGGQRKSNETTEIAVKLIPLDVVIPDENYIGLITDGFGNICETDDFLKELEIANKTGQIGITPKVLFSKIIKCEEYKCPKNKLALPRPKKIGLIIMEKFGVSLEKFILDQFEEFMTIEEIIFKQIESMICQIYKMNDIHINVVSDIHYGNILIDPLTIKIKLLDLYYPRHSESETLLSLEESVEIFRNKWQDALDYAQSLKRK